MSGQIVGEVRAEASYWLTGQFGKRLTAAERTRDTSTRFSEGREAPARAVEWFMAAGAEVVVCDAEELGGVCHRNGNQSGGRRMHLQGIGP